MATVGSRRAAERIANVVRMLGLLIVVILVLHILLTVFGANPANSFAAFIASWANTLSLDLAGLFQLPDPHLAVGASYGLAAVLWLIITSIAVGLVRRVG